jgi:hypothetical protein
MAEKQKDPPKPKKATREKSQRERFIETARAVGVDETGAEFEAALKKIAPPRGRAQSE